MPLQLITTPLDPVPVPEDHGVILGEWCNRYDSPRAPHPDDITLDYHWDDRDQLARDVERLQKLNHRLLHDLRDVLNDIHGVNGSCRYWHLLLGYWLTQCTAVLFDRWTMLQRAAEQIPDCKMIACSFTDDVLAPQSTAHAGDRFVDDAWNHALFVGIARERKLIPVKASSRPLLADTQHPWHETTVRLADRLKQCINRLGPHPYVLVRTGLGRARERSLSFRLGQLPAYWQTPPLLHSPYQAEYRSWHIMDESAPPDEQAIRSWLPRLMPRTFLEGFARVRQQMEDSGWPRAPKVIFTANSHFADDAFKIWAAARIDQGTRLVVGQHGGGAFHRFNGASTFEVDAADRYLSTGNGNVGNEKIRDVGRFNNLIEPDVWNPQGPAMLVMVAMPRYSFDLRAMPIAGQMIPYFEEQFLFYESLSEPIRDAMHVRIYPKGDYGWCQKQRWLDRFPTVTLDEGERSMQENVRNTRLFISTYNATTYNETLAANIPTLMVWNPRFWEVAPYAEDDFAELQRVGIFHTSPGSAAAHVNRIWEDVASWWNDPALQETRLRFCRKYAWLPDDILPRLAQELRHAASMESTHQ